MKPIHNNYDAIMSVLVVANNPNLEKMKPIHNNDSGGKGCEGKR